MFRERCHLCPTGFPRVLPEALVANDCVLRVDTISSLAVRYDMPVIATAIRFYLRFNIVWSLLVLSCTRSI